MLRSVRWLDRCIAEHEKSGKNDRQNLFAIIQGGLDHDLRGRCLDEMLKRQAHVPGYAIGGLSGGEAKGAVPVVLYRPCHLDEMIDPQIRSGRCEHCRCCSRVFRD